MPELDLLDANNKKIGTVEADSSVFDVEVREHLVHQYVVCQLAAKRGGNAATKSNKGELHGSGKKPWKQKGTGRARAGNSRSPLWRGGMTVFGPTPRDYSFKMSKKSKRNALKRRMAGEQSGCCGCSRALPGLRRGICALAQLTDRSSLHGDLCTRRTYVAHQLHRAVDHRGDNLLRLRSRVVGPHWSRMVAGGDRFDIRISDAL